MNVTIIGAGYVGLVASVCLATKGHRVTCVDVRADLVERLNRGEPHLHEAGLEELLRQVVKSGSFVATTELNAALDHGDVVIVAVGTPAQNGVIDLRSIVEVSSAIGSYLRNNDRYLAIVVKSTVPPGTTDTLVRTEIASASDKNFPSFGLGMNPEFLREGDAIADFMEPDRLVLGYEDDRTLQLLEELYAPWNVEKLRVNTRTAELIKYASNVFLATQISAMNEIANLAVALGDIDIMDVVRGVTLDKRWNPIVENRRISPGILSYLVPGCGFGGSCLPKDLQALRALGVENGVPMHVVDAVLQVNESQPHQVIEIIQDAIPVLVGKTVLILGLAFKPGTDDVRESASLRIVQSLLDKGARVLLHDPIAKDNFKRALGGAAASLSFVESWTDSLPSADVIIVATAWPEYRSLPRLDLTGKLVFDARRMFQPIDFRTGRYLAIGRRLRPQPRKSGQY